MLEDISCPFCKCKENSFWATDNGFKAVKCDDCGFVFVNPRPKNEFINKAVITGTHSEEANFLNVVTKMIPKKVDYYEKVFKEFFIMTLKNKIKYLG